MRSPYPLTLDTMADDGPVATRLARSNEGDEIRAVVRAAYARWIPIIGREPLPMNVDYEAALREHRFDVIDDRDRILGLVETMVRSDHIWIGNVAVRSEAQGRGIGRRLLRHAEGLGIEAALGEVRLLTNGAFKDNVTLYEWVGYRIDREEAFLNGTTVYMSKKLR